MSFRANHPRIAVVGTTGSGKTTLAQTLGKRLDLAVIELDSIHWGPNWTPIDLQVFRQQLSLELEQPRWVVDGNYSQLRDLIWSRADTLIWLDYAFPIIFWLLARRTIGRIARREVLWNGNRENFRGLFFSRDSLFLWALKTHSRHRREFPECLQMPEYRHLNLIHLRSLKETQSWLLGIHN